MIKEFSPEVTSEIRYYVYRLIDPRNGNTFYVGKGNGNRVFSHMNDALNYEGYEDEASEKIGLIREIRRSGLDIIHVIHRHGLDSNTAMEVEAALIDAYPGLTNKVGGYSTERGTMSAFQIQDKYKAPVIDDITEKCIIIKVTPASIDSHGGTVAHAFYEATRSAWRLSMARAKNADYVVSVLNGIVKAVYCDLTWSIEPDSKRLKFEGIEACKSITEKYVGKRIPQKYSKRGAQSPCLYVNC